MKGFYPEDKWVEANGLQMHYLDWGGDRTKKPLVLVHGIGGHAHMFDNLAPKFSDDWHVVALDSRGCGDTDWSPLGYSAQSQAEDIASFAKFLYFSRTVDRLPLTLAPLLPVLKLSL